MIAEHSSAKRLQTREQNSAAGCALGRRGNGIGKDRPALGQFIQIWGLNFWIAGKTHRLKMMVLGENEDNIRPRAALREGYTDSTGAQERPPSHIHYGDIVIL